jgi:DNA-binding NarL/FixJ family response regulator
LTTSYKEFIRRDTGASMDKIRVILADDHPAFREGLERLLREEEDIEVIGQAGDGEEAISIARETQPDVAIIDVAMPKLDGIGVTKEIKEASPQTTVLILSAYNNEPYVLSAIEAGAEGYLLKSVRVREVAAAIRALHNGETVLDSSAARKIFRRLEYTTGKAGAMEASQKLHPREIDVLKLVAKGMSNKEIAQELVISVRTVQTHITNILSKLDVNSRTEAVVSALREGWITLNDLP